MAIEVSYQLIHSLKIKSWTFQASIIMDHESYVRSFIEPGPKCRPEGAPVPTLWILSAIPLDSDELFVDTVIDNSR